jgi:hypothetical protein
MFNSHPDQILTLRAASLSISIFHTRRLRVEIAPYKEGLTERPQFPRELASRDD